MRRLLLILFLSFFSFNKAQTHRFVYEMMIKKDSTSEKVDKSNMILDINGNDVQFYEFKAIEIDSLNSLDENSVYTISSPFARLKRKLSSEVNSNYFLVGGDYFYFESSDKILWKILPDLKEKNKMKLQKATAAFGGRTWVAWFDGSQPFSEGPYKFNGLPGLVVEVEDSKKVFKFELIDIEKPKYSNPKIVEDIFRKKPLKISQLKYNEILIANYNDPYNQYRSMKPGSWSIGTLSGETIRTLDGLTKLTRDEQEKIRKNYNPIELDKAVLYEK